MTNKRKSKKIAVQNKNTGKYKLNKSAKLFHILTSIVMIITSLILYKLYETLTSVPPLPQLDLNIYWGPEVRNNDTTIRKFKPLFTDSMEADLVKRFTKYRSRPPVQSLEDSACTYGLSSEAVTKMFDFWQFKYKIDEREKYLNKYDHFKTNIQGLDIHFVHVKPKINENVKVLPILLLHGWPSSFRDFFEVIPVLTTPQDGYEFVFEVIVPSIPGFIYSDAPLKPGLGPGHIAVIIRNLLHRLGFKQYYIHGGDFGHFIGSNIATLFPNEVLGFHSNFLIDFSPMAQMKWLLVSLVPRMVVNKEFKDKMYLLSSKFEYFLEESGYMHIQGSKPDTVGVGLNESPVGLASYLLDRYMVFSDPSNKNSTDCGLSKYNIRDFLDNVMLYWSSKSITTAVRLYKESYSELEHTLLRIPTKVPTWSLSSQHELMYQPEWILKSKYQNLLGVTHFDYGGHYFALEHSVDLANDIFNAVDSFLKFNKSK